MFTKTEKKQLAIFLAVAYGVTFLMGILMWYGYGRGIDVSVFPNAQMTYPAAGVMLAFRITRKADLKMPKWFFGSFLAMSLAMIVTAVLSIVFPDEIIVVSGTAPVSLWILAVQMEYIAGSLICLAALMASGKERREAYGLRCRQLKLSFACALLFLGLYLLRALVGLGLVGEAKTFTEIFKSPITWLKMAVLPINFIFVFAAFLGEEYGWRYYLQPLLQRKYGLRLGVIILGVVWGLWHLPVDFFYYSPDAGLAAAVSQQITCITLGIFFAWAYMITDNIWVPVALHYLNNNMVPILSGNYSSDVLSNQSIAWSDLPMALLINTVVFGVFLLAKPFRKKPSE